MKMALTLITLRKQPCNFDRVFQHKLATQTHQHAHTQSTPHKPTLVYFNLSCNHEIPVNCKVINCGCPLVTPSTNTSTTIEVTVVMATEVAAH